ncbi:MAG: filamentous hemagglutinin N-terminal domain-containing protein [Rhodocyclaceae bacterium]|nr:MAG: filamentous hemagglutinin N-terminal domain-containing protein [Rhodocyclaceae bacterium]
MLQEDTMKTIRPYRRAPAPRILAAALALAFSQAWPAWALPEGNTTAHGVVEVGRPDASRMVIRQASDKAIVNWQGFSIGAGEQVRIEQPGAGSAILNRVTGASRSEIQGRLDANGKVFLINRNGVVFGETAAVNVGSLVASTLDIDNDDFVADRLRFRALEGPAAVENAGSISVADRGTVALMGGRVANNGTIRAQLGTVAMAAGEEMTLDLAGDGLSRLTVTRATLDALVANGGAVIADGGQVLLSARALAEISSRVVNQTGVVRARGLSERGGRIVLDGGDSGVTEVSGVLDASAPQAGGRGGEVQVLGHHVAVSGAAALDASGAAGGGAVLVGGDYQGRNPAVRNAKAAYVGPRASVKADATVAGTGGKVVAWSDEATRAHGSFSARGGPAGGDGGVVETSGGFLDVSGARVSATAPAGKAGQWLLDPTDLRIVAGDANDNIEEEAGPVFFPVGSPASIGAIVISNALNQGTSVVVRTGTADVEGEAGDITMERDTEQAPAPAILYTGGGRVSLTLEAHRDIRIEPGARIEAVGAGSLDVDLSADTAAAETGGVRILGAIIDTNGGALRIYGQGDADNGYASGREDEVDLAGVRIEDSTIDTGAGDISIRGSGEGGREGVSLQGVIEESGAYSNTIEAPGGTVRIYGVGEIGGAGVQSSRTGILGGRGVLIDGTSAADDGVRLSESRVEATLGAVNIIGLGEGNEVVSHGVNVLDSTISGFAGVDLRGENTHDDDGVKLERSVIESKAGSVGIFGKSLLAYGVYVPASSQQSPAGNSEIFGASGVEIRGESSFDAAVNLYRTSIASGGGDVTIAGSSGSEIGVRLSYGPLDAEETSVRSGTGRLEITGDTTATSGLGLALGNVVLGGGDETQLGDIILRARNGGATDSIELHYFDDGITEPASILTAGSLVLVPGGLNGGDPVRADAVPIGVGTSTGNGFEIEPRDLAAIEDVASVVFGSDTHTGQISTSASGLMLNADLTLQNEGDGSSGINFGGLEVSGHTLILASTGPLVQATGGSIVADALLVRATDAANIDLTKYANSVGTLAVDPPASFAFVNDGPVVIGPLSGPGYSTTSGTVQVLAAADSSAYGDFFVQTINGSLTLGQSITTLDANSNITLVADGRFFAAPGAELTPGTGGRWQVWASTWGTAADLGDLADDASRFYGCSFSDGCVTGVTLPATGNLMVFEGQPTLSIFARDASLTYGDAIPELGYDPAVDGLVNGDLAADVLSGALGTTAVQGSPVGDYTIDNSSGGLVSPAGYLLDVSEGSLTIDPASLLVTVDPVSRLYGAANPAFSAAVSGFVLGDTLANATTGTLALATQATERSAVGRYAVTASGLSAGNYVIESASSNAQALSIDPATLLVTVDPVSRLYGAANPAFSATVSGFLFEDSLANATTGTLALATPATERSAVGRYAVTASGLSAGNYVIASAESNAQALAIDPATLTYVATPATRPYSVPNPPLSGSVSGFVVGDTLETATSGVLVFASPAGQFSPPGAYPIEGSGLSAQNYRFEQALENLVALTVTARAPGPEQGAVLRPTGESSRVHERNFGLPPMCFAGGPLIGAGAAQAGDLLAMEWSRVRSRPNLSNCIGVDERNPCSDF